MLGGNEVEKKDIKDIFVMIDAERVDASTFSVKIKGGPYMARKITHVGGAARMAADYLRKLGLAEVYFNYVQGALVFKGFPVYKVEGDRPLHDAVEAASAVAVFLREMAEAVSKKEEELRSERSSTFTRIFLPAHLLGRENGEGED